MVVFQKFVVVVVVDVVFFFSFFFFFLVSNVYSADMDFPELTQQADKLCVL